MDIKPCNILLSEISENNYKVKLSDFGTSRVSKNTVTNTSAKGTCYYMSPEMLLIQNGLGTGEFNPELSDIFSLGISFVRILL